MITALVQDACHLLQGDISPDTGIILDLRREDALPVAHLLIQYDLPAERQIRLLSIYIAIKLALQRHRDCNLLEPGDELTRKVLDGDYLYSFYVQQCLRYEEFNLLTHLAPTVKQIQIKRVEERPEDERLATAFEVFLRLEHHRNTTRKAI
ncbi:hypothetical protein QNH46_03630 [Paenibacillus woosongensis]|uniref:Uncharacterized protein n=1 Tax=Paenibacillus woosongensis TaxID=307580 RepID=A0AA95I4P5_9BACL|nr:hypothetical protein [Paenibacillus woosongensis]WHX49785.1 hypothetical protein QNH46_03630 [Paenibacillus woosongensis]